MKLVRSNTPEVVQAITSDGVRASRWINDLISSGGVANIVAAFVLAIGLGVTSLGVVRFGIPIVVALNVLLLCRARSVRRNWVLAITADRAYVRLAVSLGRWGSVAEESEVVAFELPEIVSISVRSVEFLYLGVRRTKRWLVIEPAKALSEEVSDRLLSLSCGTSPCDPEMETLVADERGRLTIEWRLYRPALRVFMNEVGRKCPSLAVTEERRLKLDLNGIWHQPEECRRQVLAEAKRFGFGAACVLPLMRKEHISFSQSVAYMAGVEQRAGADLAATAGGSEFAFWRRVQGPPPRKARKINAPKLEGTIEYGATNISATLIQEYTPDWNSEVSAVLTDRAGHFELPPVSPGPIHYLVFSRRGTQTLYLEVTVAPEAPPLVVRLHPR